jgi:hypothetical protein
VIGVGVEPDRLCDVDKALPDWQARAGAGTLAITDVVAAPRLPSGCDFRVLRVIADASIAGMARICGSIVTPL